MPVASGRFPETDMISTWANYAMWGDGAAQMVGGMWGYEICQSESARQERFIPDQHLEWPNKY